MSNNLIKILETKRDDKLLEYIDKEFKKNNIKYKIDLQEKWQGIRVSKYIGIFVIYVQEDFESKALKIINKYNENVTVTNEKEYSSKKSNKDSEYDFEKESKKIEKKQKTLIRIFLVIVVCMVLSIIIASSIA